MNQFILIYLSICLSNENQPTCSHIQNLVLKYRALAGELLFVLYSKIWYLHMWVRLCAAFFFKFRILRISLIGQSKIHVEWIARWRFVDHVICMHQPMLGVSPSLASALSKVSTFDRPSLRYHRNRGRSKSPRHLHQIILKTKRPTDCRVHKWSAVVDKLVTDSKLFQHR